MNADANQVAYLRWLSAEHPAIYRRAVATGQAVTLRGLGWINFVVQAVATAGSAVLQKKQIDKQISLQKKALAISDAQAAADREQAAKLALLEVNTKRAASGLPPVDMTGKVIASAALPTPSALAPYVAATGAPSTSIIPGIPNYAVYGGGALIALGVLWAVARR